MIEVSDVKKLGPKDGRRDMDYVPFRHLTVGLLFCSEIKTVLLLPFLAKILLWLWTVLFGLNRPEHSNSSHLTKPQDRLSIQRFR